MSTKNVEPLSNEILEARKKMSEKFGNLKLGGKGKIKKLKKLNQELKRKRKYQHPKYLLLKIKKYLL